MKAIRPEFVEKGAIFLVIAMFAVAAVTVSSMGQSIKNPVDWVTVHGFELYNEQKKPVPEVSNTAYAWGGLYGAAYIIDPANDMIALFYLNMPRHEPLYQQFLSKAYQLFETNSIGRQIALEQK